MGQIRKEGKAHWVFVCEPCRHTSPVSPDLLRAQEWKLGHDRSAVLAHIGQVFTEAFEPFVTFVKKFATAEHFQDDYIVAPPPENLPLVLSEHDEDICSTGEALCHECYAAGADTTQEGTR